MQAEAQAPTRPTCPRCGSPVSWVEKQRKGSRVYYVAVHYLGYSREGGRVRKQVRKCYLGPEEYDYVTRLHQNLGIVLEGAVVDRRVVHYLDAFVRALSKAELDRPTLVEIVNKLEYLTSRLREYVRKLEELEEEEATGGG